MGKSRTTTKQETYITETGNEVDSEGHTQTFMNTLEYHLDKWLNGYYNSTNIIFNMSDEEIHYLLDHMQSSEGNSLIPTGHLTRIELRKHADGLKEGDVLTGNNLFRSFSREPSGSGDVMEGYMGYMDVEMDDLVVYRTVGNVPFFDPSTFSNPYPDQVEAFVPKDMMRVSKIHDRITDDDEFYQLTGIDVHIPYLSNIKVVDIEYDPTIRSVPVHTLDGDKTINLNK